jgi:uncharacterized protein YoxC
MVWEQFVPTVGSNTLADSALLVIDTGEVVQYLNTVVRELATDVSKDVMGADEKIALSESMTLVLKSIVELEKFDHVYFPPMRDV